MVKKSFKYAIDNYIRQVPNLKVHCERCLNSKRWDGSIVLMVVDASFTSIGLNYFSGIIPKVEEFEKVFVKTDKITSLNEIVSTELNELRKIWKNKRSWHVGKSVSIYFSSLMEEYSLSEREALRFWAKNTKLNNWKEDPIGKISGVGINTYQYLRMMGGIDTLMPDKIIKKTFLEILDDDNLKYKFTDDMEFIEFIHDLAENTGYRPIELCWATWLNESDKELTKTGKYDEVITRI
jgi:hypothetical protein|tara:strand:- start:1179 stop:1889 length:711 start_codon:yes stop_codon:yes gene_type:complete